MTRVASITDPAINVLAEAAKYRKVRENPVNSNRSVAIDYWLQECGVPLGLPWCMAFAWNIGRQVLGHAWPVPRTALVQDVYEWAVAKSLLRPVPEQGDLFLLYYPRLGRHGHIGFVVEPLAGGYRTCEGNTAPESGSREGYGVFERVRSFNNRTKYVRWMDALPYQESG
jgi:hypothetical protein